MHLKSLIPLLLLAYFSLATCSVVKINVGGTVFTTTNETIIIKLGRLRSIILWGPSERDENGIIFVDRSPKHFETILAYHRDGLKITLPTDENSLNELIQEANYYKLTELADMCTNKRFTPKLKFINGMQETAAAILNYPMNKDGIIIAYYPNNANDTTALSIRDFVQSYGEKFDTYFHSNDENSWKFKVFSRYSNIHELVPQKLKLQNLVTYTSL